MTNKADGAETAVVDYPEAQVADPAPEVAEPPFPIRVAIIDDGVAIPSFDLFDDPNDVRSMLNANAGLDEDLATIGAERNTDPAVNLTVLIESGQQLPTLQHLAELSAAFSVRWEDYLFYRRLKQALESLVGDVIGINPFTDLEDLSDRDLVFLDFYLEDTAKGSALAESIAKQITEQPGRSPLQQIILMSNRESVSKERRTFRKRTEIRGATFAFVPKNELSSSWKVYCHLAVLDRARPLAPKIDAYQDALSSAVRDGADAFLELVHELDIDDYAHLQSVALMKDGDPLGEYISSLFASELTSRTIEAAATREAERGLDSAEFPQRPFATSEPSTIVKSLFHSALMSVNVGELRDHPRAEPGGPHAGIPLVRMGDLFFSKNKDRAICVVSADCDLAFSTTGKRTPDPNTAVLLVSGPTQQVTGKGDTPDLVTAGLVDGDEVYQINWEFAAYQSVTLDKLKDHLEANGYDITMRDRLRAPFSFELQQSFGSRLFRVGTPAMPPIKREVRARAFLVDRGKIVEERTLEAPSVFLTWYKEKSHVRLTISHVDELRSLCVSRLERLELERDTLAESLAELDGKQLEIVEGRIAKLEKRCSELDEQLEDVTFWDHVHGDHAIGSNLNKLGGIGKMVLGDAWDKNLNNTVVLQIDE